jgi:UDP-glucose 4-epimerase
MNNLLLGGAGFIGQHLAHRLLQTRQERVTIIDSLKTSSIDVNDFAEYKNLFEFIEADLTEMGSNELLKMMQKHHRVFHLAGSVGVEHIDKNPSETMFNNLNLSNKLLPVFQQYKRPVIFSSTSEIYGEGPFNEEDNASIGPSSKMRWSYACTKLMTEFMFRGSEFPFTIVRFFNVVGPGQLGDYGMVLPRFVEAAKRGENLIVYGDGSQKRCFCHVHDAVDALIKLAAPDITSQRQLFNIGRDDPITIKDLAETVIRITGSSSNIVYVPYEQAFSNHHGDIKYRVPDLTKIRQYIGYKPERTLDDIVRDML